jgi:hypothetical protein
MNTKVRYVDDEQKLTVEDYMKKNKVIYVFVKNNNGNRKGVVCAIGPGQIGWSKCVWYDVWNKHDALSIAIRRAMKPGNIPLDKDLKYKFDEMMDRSARYFKR